MFSNPSPESSSDPEQGLQEKLIGSIWLQAKQYPYLFNHDGSCQILSHGRSGHYTISPDGRSVSLTWTDPAHSEELRVLEDGNLFLGGSILVAIDPTSRQSPFPCYPLPQPVLNSYQLEIDTGKMPNYGQIILNGRQVRFIHTGYGGNLLSDEVREFDSEEEAEDYYHCTIHSHDPYYSPGHINEPIYLELCDGHSQEFDEVTVNGLTVTIRYGQIGTAGETESSTYKSPRKALAAAEKHLNEKLRQGYIITAIAQRQRSSPDLDIDQLIRPAWKPIVSEGDGDLLASKFGGRPWLAPEEAWLTCPHCSQPMQLFLQLNLAQLPEPVREEFGTGLLQMFHCLSIDCAPEPELGTIYYGRVPYLITNVRMRLIQPVGIASMPPLPQIDGEDYGTYVPAKTITDWQEIADYPHPDELVALVYGWDQAGNSGLYDQVVQRLGLDELADEYDEQYPTDEGDKLGGYSRWVQDMECPGCPVCHAPMRQVFQLASCENLTDYAFGDMGIAHILQCQTHKDQLAFIWACG